MSTKRKHFPRPLGVGATKRWVLFHPAYLAKTRLLGARSSRYQGVSAGVPIKCGSARRYVHTYRGHVNKSPGRTCRLAHVIRALVKINPVALRATRIGTPRESIAQDSRRKIRGTRQQQPGLLARALPLPGRCHRFESDGLQHDYVESGSCLLSGCRYEETPGFASSCPYTYSCLRRKRIAKTP